MLSYEGREPTEQDRAADDDPQPRPGGDDAPAADGEEVLIDNVAAEAEDDPAPAADPDPADDDDEQ